MSVYCTVEEAWGENFEGKEFFKPKQRKNIREGFADIEDLSKKQKIFTADSQKLYKPDDDFVHSSDKYRNFRLRQPTNKDYNEFNPNDIPKSYDREEYSGYGTGGDFYDFDRDCADPKNRGVNDSEPQFLPNPYPDKYRVKKEKCFRGGDRGGGEEQKIEDSDLCDNVTLHIMHCRKCQESVLRIIEKSKALETDDKIEKYSNIKDEDEDESPPQLDISEVILFILCGIFFIFLLDSVIAIGKRFR